MYVFLSGQMDATKCYSWNPRRWPGAWHRGQGTRALKISCDRDGRRVSQPPTPWYPELIQSSRQGAPRNDG